MRAHQCGIKNNRTEPLTRNQEAIKKTHITLITKLRHTAHRRNPLAMGGVEAVAGTVGEARGVVAAATDHEEATVLVMAPAAEDEALEHLSGTTPTKELRLTNNRE